MKNTLLVLLSLIMIVSCSNLKVVTTDETGNVPTLPKKVVTTDETGNVPTLPKTAYAGWKWVDKNVDGDTYYVDFDRIRTNGGYVYFWELQDLLKPDEDGDLSYKGYMQGDCEMFRVKTLSGIFYKQPMGEGSGKRYTSSNPEWIYLPPNSTGEEILKQVCRRAGL